MKPKKAARILESQDQRFARIGGTTQREWMESPDRVQLCLKAGTEAARLAKGRYDEFTTGVNSVKLARDVGRELAKQAPRRPSPDERFDFYLMMRASRDRGAAELLEKRGGPPAGEMLEYAERLRRGSSGEARRLGEAALEGLGKESVAEYQRQQALRKEGWSRP